MTTFELEFYEAGIKDANEARRITIASRSERFTALSKKHGLKIDEKSVQAGTAYNKGVADEINRQTRLEF